MTKRILDQALLDDLKRVSTKLGKRKVTRKEYNEHGKHSSTTVRRHFHRWSLALAKAGLEQTLKQNISAEECLRDVERVRKKLNKIRLTRAEYLKHGKYSVKPIVRHFGGWSNFLRGYQLAIEDEELRTDCVEDLEKKRYDKAIRNAGPVLEERIRKTIGGTGAERDKYTAALVDFALNKNTGKLVISENTREQEGVHLLFRGAMQFVRNPPSHKKLSYSDFEAWHAVGLIDYLLFLLKQARLRDRT